jgi:capsule polysaccharide export protein KpsE/RkpR
VAGVAAGGVSMLLPKRYTSTASILIEPPAGTDPRTFTAISPIYLESLKTYELLATSDTLFARAVGRFKLRTADDSQSIEALKARVLKATKPRDTKLLQISVTLEKPEVAKAMAQFLAEETVKLSSSVSRDAGREVIEEAQRQSGEMRVKLEEAQTAAAKVNREQPLESLRGEVDAMVELLNRLRRSLSGAEASEAEFESRAKSATRKEDRDPAAAEAASMRARAGQFARQIRELEQTIAARNRVLAERTARAEETKALVDYSQSASEAAAKRVQDLRASLGSSGERLKVIDPGIVPERPSEPRTALHAGIAVGLALLGSIVYLSIAFNARG